MALGLQDIVLTHEMCYFGVTAKCPRCSSGSSSSIVQIQNLHLAPSQLAAVPCQPSRNPDLYIHDFVFSQRPKWNVHEFLDLYLQLLPLCYCPATSSCSVALNHVLCFSTQQGQGLHFTLLQFGKCSQEKAGKSMEFTGVSLFKDYNLMFPYGVQ